VCTSIRRAAAERTPATSSCVVRGVASHNAIAMREHRSSSAGGWPTPRCLRPLAVNPSRRGPRPDARGRHDDDDAIASSRGRQKASPRRVDPGRGGDDSHVSDTEADDDMEEEPLGPRATRLVTGFLRGHQASGERPSVMSASATR
jgi:hypothetical protein